MSAAEVPVTTIASKRPEKKIFLFISIPSNFRVLWSCFPRNYPGPIYPVVAARSFAQGPIAAGHSPAAAAKAGIAAECSPAEPASVEICRIQAACSTRLPRHPYFAHSTFHLLLEFLRFW
jgi:hypothetical protein